MATTLDGTPGVSEKSPGCTDTAELLQSRFEALYATVLRYLIHRVFDAELAEDLAAEAFYRAARCVRRLHANERQIQVWLLRTATNLANTHGRRTRVRGRLLQQFSRHRTAVAESSPPGELADRQRTQQVRDVLKAMPARHQTVITLRYFMQMSFDDIAEVVRCRPDAARKRVSRAIEDLRRRMKDVSEPDWAHSSTGRQ